MLKSVDHKCNACSYVRWNTPDADRRSFDPPCRLKYLTYPSLTAVDRQLLTCTGYHQYAITRLDAGSVTVFCYMNKLSYNQGGPRRSGRGSRSACEFLVSRAAIIGDRGRRFLWRLFLPKRPVAQHSFSLPSPIERQRRPFSRPLVEIPVKYLRKPLLWHVFLDGVLPQRKRAFCMVHLPTCISSWFASVALRL